MSYDDIPNELKTQILFDMTPDEIRSIRTVSKEFNTITTSHYFLKKYRENFYNRDSYMENGLTKSIIDRIDLPYYLSQTLKPDATLTLVGSHRFKGDKVYFNGPIKIIINLKRLSILYTALFLDDDVVGVVKFIICKTEDVKRMLEEPEKYKSPEGTTFYSYFLREYTKDGFSKSKKNGYEINYFGHMSEMFIKKYDEGKITDIYYNSNFSDQMVKNIYELYPDLDIPWDMLFKCFVFKPFFLVIVEPMICKLFDVKKDTLLDIRLKDKIGWLPEEKRVEISDKYKVTFYYNNGLYGFTVKHLETNKEIFYQYGF